MQLIRGLKNWSDLPGTVVTIGNFDGVHLGHQSMFASTVAKARELDLPATVISFEPLPHEYFAPQNAPLRLHGLRDKVNSIASALADRLLLLHFDQQLASLKAEDFVTQILVDKLHMRHLVVGDDFRFGHQRSGNFQTLQKLAATSDFSVEQSQTCVHEHERVSSTRVRAALQAGDLSLAKMLLGRSYRISGRVVHGEKVGRQLGFPTANVFLGKHNPPLRGVFAVSATHSESGQQYPAVANLGERPTIGGRRLLLEVHALDASPEWYGDHLAIDFIQQLREEKRFDSLDELKAQIARDSDEARALLGLI